MRLELDPSFGEGYTSRSQWARRVTEEWGLRQLFCVACPSPHLSAHRANTKVEDFLCPRCQRRVQLKAKSGRIGNQVANSAYQAKMEAIRDNRAPDYAFMAYDRGKMVVTDLLLVPGPFLTESVVSRRKPLKPTARRKGWVGSSIHLDRIPQKGKIVLVECGRIRGARQVRAQFSEVAFVSNLDAVRRGWVTDVMACLDELSLRQGDPFSNDDLYAFDERLHRLHPNNHNVRPKIRQQLQVLAKNGVIRRTRPGYYQKL
jgi:type II restriction enzyme